MSVHFSATAVTQEHSRIRHIFSYIAMVLVTWVYSRQSCVHSGHFVCFCLCFSCNDMTVRWWIHYNPFSYFTRINVLPSTLSFSWQLALPSALWKDNQSSHPANRIHFGHATIQVLLTRCMYTYMVHKTIVLQYMGLRQIMYSLPIECKYYSLKFWSSMTHWG